MSVSASDLKVTRLDDGELQRGVEVVLGDESWVGAPIKLRAYAEIVEDGWLVLELETEGKTEDVEIGGIVLTGGSVTSKASASLSPDEARVMATALRQLADFLGDYRVEIAGSA